MSNPWKDAAAKAANAMHQGLLAATGGRIGAEVGGMPAVKLTTTGRRSGRARSVMLTTPLQQGDDVVLIASYGGDEKHPAWYLNLEANPSVTLEWKGETVQANARTATAEERSEMWPQITSKFTGYADYQTKTDREIPVVICTPA